LKESCDRNTALYTKVQRPFTNELNQIQFSKFPGIPAENFWDAGFREWL